MVLQRVALMVALMVASMVEWMDSNWVDKKVVYLVGMMVAMKAGQMVARKVLRLDSDSILLLLEY
jgi:hypothetical protein